MRRTRWLFGGGCGLSIVCIGLGLIAILIIGGSAPNPRLDPVRGFVLRVQLAGKESALRATAGTDPTPQRVTLQMGDSTSTIASKLVTAGLITDAEAFRAYVEYNGLNLQAGAYLLAKNQTIPQIARALTNAAANIVQLRVIEGWRIEQIAEAINQTPNLQFSGTDFIAAVKGAGVPTTFLQSVGAPAGSSLEGFLYPATYELPLDATAITLRDKMLDSFNTALDAQARAAIAQQGLTIYQAVTLASIVEREAIVADERPLIAGVYLNRLKRPMNLDADPTIQYALGNTRTAGTWWPNLTQADYRSVISPYNTYINAGLPPSPIASPRRDSLLAVAYPRASNYYFFRASCVGDGRHRFAETFEGQLANACP
jgi:UPF0755 protein